MKQINAIRNTPEYHAWRMARARCHNPKALAFDRYGGRGITMCIRWRDSFETFLADMGQRPSPKHELDRINNDGPYAPENCRWVLRWVNDRNRRSSVWIEYKGQRRLLIEICEELGIWPDMVRYRVKRMGWSWEHAIDTPARPKTHKRGVFTTAKTRGVA